MVPTAGACKTPISRRTDDSRRPRVAWAPHWREIRRAAPMGGAGSPTTMSRIPRLLLAGFFPRATPLPMLLDGRLWQILVLRAHHTEHGSRPVRAPWYRAELNRTL